MAEPDPQAIASGGVKAAAGELLRVYRTVDKMDRWSGGGQTLALVVKIFGWVGLLCVLWVLVVKLNDVARSLDPVKSGIVKLAVQLEQSRSALEAEDARRRHDSERLAAAAAQLAESTQHLRSAARAAADAQADALQAATEAAKEVRDAAERLRAQGAEDATAQAGLLKALDDASQSAIRARDAIAKVGDDADRSGKAAAQAARGAASAIEDLQRAVGSVDLGPLKGSVTRASVSAEELSAALEKAAKDAQRPRAVAAGEAPK